MNVWESLDSDGQRCWLDARFTDVKLLHGTPEEREAQAWKLSALCRACPMLAACERYADDLGIHEGHEWPRNCSDWAVTAGRVNTLRFAGQKVYRGRKSYRQRTRPNNRKEK